MFGSQILEVAIGVIFVYLLVSIICSAVREGIETKLKTRAAYLERGIRELLHDKDATGLAKHFYNHPLIFSLFHGDYAPASNDKLSGMFAAADNLPTYVPAKNFALTLMDLAARGVKTNEFNSAATATPITVEAIRANVLNISNPAVQRVLLSAVDTAQNDITKVQTAIEAWYDSAMDRVSGFYKQSTQWILFAVGLVVAIGLNVDTVRISQYLYSNNAARAAIVSKAEAAVTGTAPLPNVTDAKAKLDKLELPIGWEGKWTLVNPFVDGVWPFANPLIGWLMTAFAATLGAPFWFDILNKVMVIRSTVKPHEKSPEESSEDRQKPATPVIKAETPPATPVTPPPTLPVPPPTVAAEPEDEIDGCDVVPDPDKATSDEDLPPAEGGVGA